MWRSFLFSRAVLFGLWTVALVTFAFGVTMPIVTFERLFFFEKTYSLIDLIWMLFNDGEYLLSAVILVFTIIFPFLKLVVYAIDIFIVDVKSKKNFLFEIIRQISKWSMLDVMLVALTIVALKTSGVANALSNIGLYFFVISIISGALLSHIIIVRNRKGFY